MSLSDLFARASSTVSNNRTGILTAVGVAGTVSTAYLAARASFKAANKLHLDQIERQEISEATNEPIIEPSAREVVELVWMEYIPAVGVGIATIAAIIFANRLAAKEAAALAAAYGLSERAFSEYREKVVERLGKDKEKTEIRDEVVKDRLTKDPPPSTVIITGQGNVLCYDMWTGRYFESTVEKIRRAANAINYEIAQGTYCTASQFYDDLGMESTTMTDTMGWNLSNKLDIEFSSHLTQDERPALAIMITPPVADYRNLY